MGSINKVKWSGDAQHPLYKNDYLTKSNAFSASKLKISVSSLCCVICLITCSVFSDVILCLSLYDKVSLVLLC